MTHTRNQAADALIAYAHAIKHDPRLPIPWLFLPSSSMHDVDDVVDVVGALRAVGFKLAETNRFELEGNLNGLNIRVFVPQHLVVTRPAERTLPDAVLQAVRA